MTEVYLHHAYIALGSNLENPVAQLQQAAADLALLPDSKLVQVSPFYHSQPMGPQDQPDYVNAAAHLVTNLEPIQLLDALQAIELAHGRVRKQHWGARTLDLDILLIGQLELSTERLTVPHYGMKERAFVLLPLFDIAPDLTLPDGQTVRELAQHCDQSGLKRMTDSV